MSAYSLIVAGYMFLAVVAIGTAILIWDWLTRPDRALARLTIWATAWLAAGAVLTLAAGMRRAGGLGLRKLAGRIRAALRPAPRAEPALRTGKHRKPAEAR